jgi:hypothetical protein
VMAEWVGILFKVSCDGQGVEILTIIPLGEQLHPIHRRGVDAIDTNILTGSLRLAFIKPLAKPSSRLTKH